MKRLKDILTEIEFDLKNGSLEDHINSIEYDSRKVTEGDIFFSIFPYKDKGERYIKDAVLKGARYIVIDEDIDIDFGSNLIKVSNVREALAKSCQNFYDNPEKKLKIIGVTGTNGKTTSTYMLKEILEYSGFKVGLIGTIANYIGKTRIPSTNTTPEAKELMQLFRKMADENVDYVVMEVSSHSLALNRVYGIDFIASIFTNLTQDHLDFHKTFENYFNAKVKLFEKSSISIINGDSEYCSRIISKCLGEHYTYSIKDKADAYAEDIKITSRKSEYILNYMGQKETMTINIPGKYNIENSLGVALACLKIGIPISKIKEGFNRLTGVSGRCELVSSKYSIDFDIILDYAHSPDGLLNILKTAREFTKGRLISVFGCGGDRDKTKRPIMGRIGTDLSDFSIITSDNPRSEEPLSIIDDITAGINKDNYIVVEDRKTAIKKSIEMAKPADVIVIAGKGHEDYQILKTGKIHFDEREVVDKIIKELY